MLGESEGEDLGDSFAHPLFLALEPNPIERHDHDDPELRIGVYLARSGQRQDTHQGCDDPRPPAESTHHGTSFLRRPRRTSMRSEEHTSELQSLAYLVCRLLLEKKKKKR